MHRIHSIDVSETDNGSNAVIIKLGGELDDDFVPFIRMECDKTLLRNRRGGVILDLSEVTLISGSVIGHLVYFAKVLIKDGIKLILVVSDTGSSPVAMLPYMDFFDAVVPELTIAKEILEIEE